MPSPRAVLRDIHDHRLNPNTSYRGVKGSGYIYDHAKARVESDPVEIVPVVEQPVVEQELQAESLVETPVLVIEEEVAIVPEQIEAPVEVQASEPVQIETTEPAVLDTIVEEQSVHVVEPEVVLPEVQTELQEVVTSKSVKQPKAKKTAKKDKEESN